MADWEAAQAIAGEKLSWGVEQIKAFLDAHPPVAHRMIEDIYYAVKAQEERDRGETRTGRRPRIPPRSLAEMYSTIFPEPYSMDPFPEAMEKLLRGQSQRAFSKKVPCHQTTMSRMMAGKLEPDLTMLEQIAAAARVKPAYFMEWRALALAELVRYAMMERPQESVGVLLRTARPRR